MTHPYYPSGNPRFNHVAMSVPSSTLRDPDRADLTRFMHEVLGFDELPTMTVEGRKMIFGCVHWDQFVFLIAEDEPMACPRLDHYGLSVGTLAELEAARARAEEANALLQRFEAIGAKAKQTTESVRAIDPADRAAAEAQLDTLVAHMTAIVEDAQTLHHDAQAADLSDLAQQADALRQQILGARNKLSLAVAKRKPS